MTDPGGFDATDAVSSPSVGVALRAGVALFNEGYYLAAHEPWEAAWLPLDASQDPIAEPLLHGLIQVAAATHHARIGNESGAIGCAEGALSYLATVENEEGSEGAAPEIDQLDDVETESGTATASRTELVRFDVQLAPIRAWCQQIAIDPSTVSRAEPPHIAVDGATIGFADLDLAAILTVVPVLADTLAAAGDITIDPEVAKTAVALGRAEQGTGRSTITQLLIAFVREPPTRPQVAARLTDHVERAERKRRDVDGLF